MGHYFLDIRYTLCPRRLDLCYVVSYYILYVKTSLCTLLGSLVDFGSILISFLNLPVWNPTHCGHIRKDINCSFSSTAFTSPGGGGQRSSVVQSSHCSETVDSESHGIILTCHAIVSIKLVRMRECYL